MKGSLLLLSTCEKLRLSVGDLPKSPQWEGFSLGGSVTGMGSKVESWWRMGSSLFCGVLILST